MPFRRAALWISFSAAILMSPRVQADDIVLHAAKDVECPVAVTADKKWHVLKVRVSPDNTDGGRCRIDKEKTQRALTFAFRALAESGDPTRYESVFLGRIEFYKWLSRYLVVRARGHQD